MVCIESFSIHTFWGALKPYSIVANLLTWGHLLKTEISMRIGQWLRDHDSKRQRETSLKRDPELYGVVDKVHQHIASLHGTPQLPSGDANMIDTIVVTIHEALKGFSKGGVTDEKFIDSKNKDSPTQEKRVEGSESTPLSEIMGNASMPTTT
jgi:hypothetical protein